ncbi:hypothetical protein J2X67_005414 [Variovorax sp. 3319]|nr:hypothetical protein [Variovorax sp. 3319]
MNSFRSPNESTPAMSATPQNAGAPQPSRREELYRVHFQVPSQQTQRPAEFIEQVNGYGVQMFSQASVFVRR